MKRIRVIDVAWPNKTDIDQGRQLDAKTLDSLIKRCVARITDGLKSATNYSEIQRHHLSEMFEGMGSTHVTIRSLLTQGSNTPTCVDAVALARLQLETLYRVCLIVQDASFLDLYIKNHWKDIYVLFLLARIEQRNLPRFNEYLNETGPRWFEPFRVICGVTNDEKATIEHDELGTLIPDGAIEVRIEQFPSPRKVIEKITNSDQKRMLKRLYIEYQRLCGFAHGSAQASFFRTTFSGRPPATQHTSESQRQDVFEKQILDLALLHSSLSTIQSTCEMASVLPPDVELARASIDSWNVLSEMNLLGRAIWEIRARSLLGVVQS
jgi:hypothetical protein